MELRVVSAEDGPAPQALSLREAFHQFRLPTMRGDSAATVRDYATVCDHWEAFVSELSQPIDPQRASSIRTRAQEFAPKACPVDDVYQIEDWMLDEFGQWLMEDRDPLIKPATVTKYRTKLNAIFNACGPRTSRHPRAAGLIEVVPRMSPVMDLVSDDEDPEPDAAIDLSDEELSRIYAACDIATWPAVEAPLQWKTYIVTGACLGLRPGDGAKIARDAFRFSPESPSAGSSHCYEHGWLKFLPRKTRRSKRTPLVLPLPPCVAAHVMKLTHFTGRNPAARLYSWKASTQHSFRHQWTAIVKQAGLAHIQRKHLRSTANMRWNRVDEKRLGQYVLGHARRSVNESHYFNVERDLIQAAPRIQVPECFQLVSPDQQLYLF